MKNKRKPEIEQEGNIINFNLLLLLLFANSLALGIIHVNFESNDILRAKIVITWLLVKALIILLNVKYMKSLANKLIHDKEIKLSSGEIIRNTHLISCICSFVGFLMMKV